MNTIIEILNWRAQEHPERRACTLLGSSGDAVNQINYRQIDVRARAIAVALRSRGKSGPVLVMYPSSIEYITSILGCFYAGMIAVPVFPPRSARTQGRVRGIAVDSGATLALADPHSAQALSQSLESIPVETIPDAAADEWCGPGPAPDTLAVLQYTSGSTSEPRGVMVSHENLVAAEQMIQSAFGVTESSVIVSWLPMFHDMGLMGTVLQPLFAGAASVLMSPAAFLQRPARWLEAISRFRGTIAGGPNSAYELCVDSVPAEKRAQLDLSTWEVAFNGSEPVRKETIDRFSSAFSSCGFRRFAFRPCYGLAESTLLVTAALANKDVHAKACSMAGLQSGHVSIADPNDKDTRWFVSCGAGTPPGDLRIIDASTGCALPERRVGEICVIGPHVALGYWNRTQDSEATFGVSAHDKETRSLRTGDLGFLLDGQLYVTGRLKDLIIVRGQNYYPEDIEYTSAASHETLRQQPCAAFAVESHGREEVVVVQESRCATTQEAEKVIAAIRRRVAFYHGVPLSAVLLVRPHSLPKTTSGKIQRGACRSAFLAGTLQPIAEWRAEHASPDFSVEDDGSRAWLRDHLATTLGWSVSDIEDDRPLVEYGLDSLGAVKLAHAIESRFGVRTSPADFLEDMTLADLASRIAQFPAAISRVNETIVPDEYPLSYGQLALWHQQQIAPRSSTYNIANVVRVRSPLDVEAMRRAFRHVVQRHPVLSSTFTVSNGTPVHCFRTRLTPDLVEEDVFGLDSSGLHSRLHDLAWRPFDLRREPPIRLHLVRSGEDESILLLVVHHLVADLWSLALLVKELGEAYSAFVEQTSPLLPPLQAQYYEFVQEQSRYIEARGANDLAYWRKELQDPLPVLQLPVERPAPSSPDYRSAIEPFALDEDLTARLKVLAKTMNATLYVTTLAIFQILLHRYSGQKDIIVGSPISGRDRREFAQTVGYFVNTLALRVDFSNDPTFGEHLCRTRKTVLDAFRHQEYPFRLVVEHLQPTVIAGEHPVFQVMFILQAAEDLAPLAPGQGGVQFRSGPLLLESIALEERLSNFPLVLNLAEMDGNLIGGFEYQTARFDRDAIRRMADHFRVLAWNAVENVDARISRLVMLTPEEHHKALAIWNDTAATWPPGMSLWQSLEYWIHKSPDAIALVDDKQHISWRELDARTQRLACDLRNAGVGPDRVAGVCMERSVDLAIAFASVLRAGGAYLPIDTEDPPQRIERLLKAANASVVVTKSALKPLLSGCGQLAIVAVDEPSRSLAQDNAATDLSDRSAAVRPDNLAYVLFTSGSTGGPKGVMNTHRGICNRIHWMQAAYQLGPDDRVLQKTPHTFDVSVWEFFWPLTSGGALVLARPGGQRDPRYIAEIIAREQISVVHFVPSMMKLFLQEVGQVSLPSLRHVISSGEALSVKLQDQWHTQFAAAALHNLYGPTEAAVDVSHWTCERREGQTAVPIGSPISNTQLYVLEKALGIVPVGIPGELHIGGDALARGYVGQPALTAAAFIPSLFGQPGSRLYRTGDIARYRYDGAIEFIGRLDDQTKIRGMRVELGEVEAAIKTHPNITDAVVLGGSAASDGSMTAWVVWRDTLSASIRHLLAHLKTILPPYMVPNRIVALDRLPVSPNGKLNRHALASDEHFKRSLDTPLLMPRDPVEIEISAIWQDILNVMPIGVHDNFFNLGGHSLQVAQLLERVRERFQVVLPMNRFFDEPTIAEMAVAIQDVSRTSLANAVAADAGVTVASVELNDQGGH